MSSCLEWERPSVFLEGMAATCTGEEPLGITQECLPREGTEATTWERRRQGQTCLEGARYEGSHQGFAMMLF